MKKDLLTAIIASVVGVLISYFVTNMFFGELESVTIPSADPNLTVDLVEPSNEVFNYLAVNPTVEVYVGECAEYDDTSGECIKEKGTDMDTSTEDEENEEKKDNAKDEDKEESEDESDLEGEAQDNEPEAQEEF